MKATKTREYILEKAATLFNQKGFDGTSLSDLELATGLTKGALYGHFVDKQTLAGEAFAYATNAVKSRSGGLLKTIPTYRGKLLALLDFFSRYVLEPPIPGGCPLLNTAIEADDHRPDMRNAVTVELQATVDFISGLLKKGIRAGEFRKDFNPKELAFTFFCAIEGAIMFSRVKGSTEPMDIIVKDCKNKLEQISNPLCKNG